MGAAAVTGDNAGVHIQLQSKAVEQVGVALANGSLVYQRSVCGVLQQIRVIVQMVIVVADGLGNVVVNAFDLLVIGVIIQIQVIQQVFHIVIHLGFLLCGGIVAQIEVHVHMIGTVIVRPVILGLPAAVGKLQIVAFLGLTGVIHSLVGQSIDAVFQVILGFEMQGDEIISLDHGLAQLLCGSGQGDIVFVALVDMGPVDDGGSENFRIHNALV